MSAILYGMIHDRALKSYIGPEVTVENYNQWVDHWFFIAAQIAHEFDSERLYQTADYVRTLIDEQKKLSKYFK